MIKNKKVEKKVNKIYIGEEGMKKIVSVAVASMALFFFSITSSMADGWTAGVAVTHGLYEATGQENEDTEITKATGEIAVTFPTIFAEYNYGNVSVGLEVIPGSVETEEASRTDYNIGDSNLCTGNDGCGSGAVNSVRVEISQHITLYAVVPVMDTGAFLKAGFSRMNVDTKDNLATGSTYPDIGGVNGGHLSLGYQHDTSAGFIRAEVGFSTYDTIKVTSTNSHKVEADIEGGWGRISLGKSF